MCDYTNQKSCYFILKRQNDAALKFVNGNRNVNNKPYIVGVIVGKKKGILHQF